MIAVLLIGGALVALGIGIWIGVGMPGVRFEPRYHRRHDRTRALNPIAWGRTAARERQRPQSAEERRTVRLR